jgi:alpha-L-fucosidase
MDENQLELNGLLSKVNKAYCLADQSKQSLVFNQDGAELRITIPEELKQPRVTVVVLEIEDDEAKVINETIQQEENGAINLPIEKCEFAIRRISYNYEEKVTHRWGENTKQGLIWTVNVTKPGDFNVVSEDNGNNEFMYNLII